VPKGQALSAAVGRARDAAMLGNESTQHHAETGKTESPGCRAVGVAIPKTIAARRPAGAGGKFTARQRLGRRRF